MELREFRLLLSSGVVDTIHLFDRGEGFELWVEGEGFPYDLSHCLHVSRKGPRRVWTSIDRALAFVRKQGWKGPVIVEVMQSSARNDLALH